MIERVTLQHRQYMILIYYEKHIWPRVQITADEMRRFYDRNIEKFSDKSDVQFRLIKVGFAENGGREGALSKAKLIVSKATWRHRLWRIGAFAAR